jgi:membrane-bound lytic murein transglycosylase A
LKPVPPPEVWDDQEATSLRAALIQSLKYVKKKPPQAGVPFGEEVVSFREIRRVLEHIKEALDRHGLGEEFYSWIEEHCRFFESTAKTVTFTGYYLASLRGSRTRTPRYRFPLYEPPKDMVRVDLRKFHFFNKFPGLPRSIQARITRTQRVVPYYSRAEIDFQGRLEGKGLEMLWVDSLVDLQALHVQGSGVVALPDGQQVLVGFADSNGLPFRGVGGYLLAEGMIPRNQASTQKVQAFLKAHPELHQRVFSQNARYIFFRKLSGGARGALGVEITPHRTLALEQSLFPSGALGLIETQKPIFEEGKLIRWETFRRLVLNQDAGAAIKGSGRVDLYHGFGGENEQRAGSMHQPGRLFFLLEK